MYQDELLSKPPAYNEENRPDEPQWIQNAPPITSKNEQSMTTYCRNRLRSVEYLDRQVERLVNTLEKDGELQNTCIAFYSHNGYHLGQHRPPQPRPRAPHISRTSASRSW